MKKVSIILAIILIACLMTTLTIAQNNTDSGNNSNQTNTNQTQVNQTDTEDNETRPNRTRTGLGQLIRRKVRAGIYTNEFGEELRIRELAQNRLEESVRAA